MTLDELERKINAWQTRPLVLLCRMPTGQMRRMSVQECVRSGCTYIQMVWDDLDKILCTELGRGDKA